MKFWGNNNKELYDTYILLTERKDYGRLAELLPELIKAFPSLLPYISTTIDSCFSKHRVYLIKTNKGIKLGYTKNTIKERFNEKRYKGSEDFQILKILREEELPAAGAVKFEEKLKQLFTKYSIKTDVIMPGKGEFYDENYLDDILKKYDTYKPKFIDIIGIKSPN